MGESPLEAAVQSEDGRIAEFLIQNNADITPESILTSALVGGISSVKRLLKYGCPVNMYDEHGRSALYEAIRRGDFNVTKLLIDPAADLED